MQGSLPPVRHYATDPLWQKLGDFHIGDSDASFSFVQRLARENYWRIDYAEQVVSEYKRFIYLIATSGRHLTPSEQVDQAWHLHLAYTRSYWQELCGEILGFELHHQPTKGGRDQQGHFKLCYAATLETYAEVFGEAAPPAFWPDPAQRFRSSNHFTWVNRAEAWVIPKPRYALPVLGLAALLPLLVTACTPEQGASPFWFWMKVAIGVWGIWFLLRLANKHLGGGRGRGNNGSGCGGGGCSSGGSGCCGGGGD